MVSCPKCFSFSLRNRTSDFFPSCQIAALLRWKHRNFLGIVNFLGQTVKWKMSVKCTVKMWQSMTKWQMQKYQNHIASYTRIRVRIRTSVVSIMSRLYNVHTVSENKLSVGTFISNWAHSSLDPSIS